MIRSGVCHVEGCTDQFVGVTRTEYLTHVYEKHGALLYHVYDTFLIRHDMWDAPREEDNDTR